MNFYIAFDLPDTFCIYWSCNLGLHDIIIVTVPEKEFASHVHAFNFLTQMSVGLNKCKRRVSWQNNGVSGISIRAAAIFDYCCSSALGIYTVWYLTADAVLVIPVFILPPDSCFHETCVAQNIPLVGTFIENKKRKP